MATRAACARLAIRPPRTTRRLYARTTLAIPSPRLTRDTRASRPTYTAPALLVMPATRTVAVRMKNALRHLVLVPALLLGVVFSTTPAAHYAHTQPAPSPARNIYHVKYVSEGAVYLDSGRNAGLEEGMLLHLVHADPNGGTTEAVRFQGQEPIADVRVFSVADSSCAAEIIKSREDLAVGDIAYLDTESVHAREDTVNAAESENYPVVVGFSYGDPMDEEIRATTVSEKVGAPIVNQTRGRIGLDLGYLAEPGGVSSRQIGLLIDADISRIGGTHWNFTGYWRGDLTTQKSGNSSGVCPFTL